jgi:hypothetical protein
MKYEEEKGDAMIPESKQIPVKQPYRKPLE